MIIYNPQVKTNININLLHTIEHQSVVCCVKFSKDGKFLATGCNKYSSIYNTETGKKVKQFVTENSTSEKDSYVRSVCFSPDGKYLVAGTEEKTVKVFDLNSGELKYNFVGHELDIYSLDYSSDNKLLVTKLFYIH
jgi:glucose repression regulatory protein TUP1